MIEMIQLGSMETVYLGFGTNLGDREANLKNALELLQEKVDLTQSSAIYETEPVGYLAQPWFLNMVCSGTTELDPAELLSVAKQIESQLGREENFRNGPRHLDIDILFYGDQVIESENLLIPHPRIGERGFVLIPMAEIAPAFIHPVTGKTVGNMLAELANPEQIRKWANV